jgi:hypothetical protein
MDFVDSGFLPGLHLMKRNRMALNGVETEICAREDGSILLIILEGVKVRLKVDFSTGREDGQRKVALYAERRARIDDGRLLGHEDYVVNDVSNFRSQIQEAR